MSEDALRLSAEDADDLAVIAACLQDALVPIGDMTFLPTEKRFLLALNRFRWDRLDVEKLAASETAAVRDRGDAPFWEGHDKGPLFERVMSGLRFESVTAVRTTGLDVHNRERILELLTIRAEPGSVLLVFAGGAAIRLEAEKLQCYLEDFGESWPTRWRPRHPDSTIGNPSR